MESSSILIVLFLSLAAVFRRSSASSLRYNISEERPINTLVANVRRDLSRRSSHSATTLPLLRYRLRNESNYFRIDSVTGELRTKSVIDRDELCYMRDVCEITADVIVEPLQYYDIVAIVVNVLDINDNPPRFPQDSVRVEVLESTAVGAAFLLPSADDIDGEDFAVKEYRMVDQGQRKFRLNHAKQADGSDQVRLRLVESLDREHVSNYSMRIVALDGGTPPQSAFLEVLIVVKDANDNPPRLERENYEATLEENLRVGTSILQVKAEDPDEGMNANLTYAFTEDTLLSHGDIFGIVADDGWIYLKGLVDYERERKLVLTVIVADQGSMALSAYARVVIYVSDVNDNAPEITVNNMPGRTNPEVRENLLPGAFASHIVVKDADGGDNGKVECSIDSSRFRLVNLQDTNSEYKLVSAVQFDREQRSEERLTITCQDRGTPRMMTSSLAIKVKIIDENDNSPRFKDDRITVRLRENNVNGTQLTELIATDADEGASAEVDFRIVPVGDSPLTAIAVNQQRFVIATTVFDYEVRHEYAYLIVATDLGTPPRSSTARLDIRIEDLNDERPSFEVDSYVFHATENLPIGTVIGRVRAWDDDRTENHRNIYYSFVDAFPYLSIDPATGEIVNTKVIDREESPSFKVKVRASNNPNSSSSESTNSDVSVKFYIDDENDNFPVISFPSSLNRTLVFPPQRERRTGNRLVKIEASDADEGLNATLSFSTDVTTDAARYFGVEASTGWITVIDDSVDDVISSVGFFHLVIKVSDRGSPPKVSTGTLDIVAFGSPEVSVEQSHSLDTLEGSWMIVVVGVGCGVLAIAVAVAVGLICVRVHRCKVKNKHKYNCRLEANRATSSGSLNKFGARASVLEGGQAEVFAGQGFRGKGKKGVRFNLDEEQGPCISSPIINAKLTCPFPDECAFHRHDSPASSTDSPRPDSIHEPLYTFRGVVNGNRYAPCPVESMSRLQRQPQPIILPVLQQRNGTLKKVDIPTIEPNLFKANYDQAGPARTPSSYSVSGRSSSLAERWSSGSLPDSGRGPSDEDDPVFYSGSQEPFFPAESKV